MTSRQPLFTTVGILLACLASSCTSTKSVTVGQYARGDQPVIRHAPETGVYKVQWLSTDRREIRTCVGSDRVIARGAPLGFATGANGQVTAIAGIEQFPLQHLPSHAHYCQWNYTYQRETHFAMGLNRAAGVAVGSALLPIVVPVALAAEYVSFDDLDDDFTDWDFGSGRVGRAAHHSSHSFHSNNHHDHYHNNPHAPVSHKNG